MSSLFMPLLCSSLSLETLIGFWNLYFFYIFGVFLSSPHLSMRYSAYWFFISLFLGFHLAYLLMIFLGRYAHTILAMSCKVSNIVTYETNKYFSIRDVGVFFPYQPFILFFDSTIISLVTKLVTTMTISIECMLGESLVFLLVMTLFFYIYSEIFHLGRISRIIVRIINP